MKVQGSTNPFDEIDERLQSIEEKLAHLSNKISSAHLTPIKYYKITDAAKLLGVAEITLYRNVQAGKIPSKKIGARIMIPGSFVDK